MDISLLLVTYNRLSLLEKAISAIKNNATDIKELIIVDNFSTDDTFLYLESMFQLKSCSSTYKTEVADSEIYEGRFFELNINVKLIRLLENTGGSGGFYEGVRFFYEQSNCNWVWGMDDDAFLEVNALKELEKAVDAFPNNNAFWSNCNNDNRIEKYVEVKYWMFVGFCLNKKLINKIGFPVKDYFIYHDDSEYANRIIFNNEKIIKVIDSKIDHGDFSGRNIWKRKLLWIDVVHPAMSEWKLYYFIRNDILKNSRTLKGKIKSMVKIFLTILKVSYINPKFLPISIIAYYHGVIGRKGKVVNP